MFGGNKMKKFIKLVFVELCIALIITFCGCGCENKKQYSDDCFYAIIKSTYKDVYDNKLFELNDFYYDNVDRFSYTLWSDSDNIGYLCIHLKKTGNKEVEKAMNHFSTLDFVERCEKIPLAYLLSNYN